MLEPTDESIVPKKQKPDPKLETFFIAIHDYIKRQTSIDIIDNRIFLPIPLYIPIISPFTALYF